MIAWEKVCAQHVEQVWEFMHYCYTVSFKFNWKVLARAFKN